MSGAKPGGIYVARSWHEVVIRNSSSPKSLVFVSHIISPLYSVTWLVKRFFVDDFWQEVPGEGQSKKALQRIPCRPLALVWRKNTWHWQTNPTHSNPSGSGTRKNWFLVMWPQLLRSMSCRTALLKCQSGEMWAQGLQSFVQEWHSNSRGAQFWPSPKVVSSMKAKHWRRKQATHFCRTIPPKKYHKCLAWTFWNATPAGSAFRLTNPLVTGL